MSSNEKIKASMELDASGVKKGAQEAVDALKGIEQQAQQTSQSSNESIGGMSNNMDELGQASQQAGRNVADSMKEVENGLNKAMSTGKKITTMLTLPIVAFGASAINTSKEFDYAMSEVKAISGATETEFRKLEEQAKHLGRTTMLSSKDAADAMKYYAMAGWEVSEIMAALPGSINLAIASNTELGLTCDIVSDAMTALKLEAKDVAEFTDILAATAVNSNTNVQMLGESFKYAAPVAGELGIKAQDLSVALGLMANAGLKSTASGNQLKTGLLRMVSPTKQIQTVMDKYGIAIQKTEDGSLDLIETMTHLREKLKGLDNVTRSSVLSTIMGKNAVAGWSSVIGASEEDFQKLTEAIYNSNGVTEEMAEIMGDNLQGKLKALGSAFEGVQIKVGEILTPAMEDLVGILTDACNWFNELDEGSQKLAVAIGGTAAAIGPLMILFAGLGKVCLLIKKGFMLVSGAMGLTVSTGTALMVGIVAIATAFAGLLGWMGANSDMLAWLQDKFGELGFVLGALGETIYGSFQMIFGNLWTFLKTTFSAIGALLKGDVKEAGAIWKDGMAEIKTTTAEAMSNITGDTNTATKKMREMSQEELSALSNTYTDTMEKMKSTTAENSEEIAETLVGNFEKMDAETLTIMKGSSDSMAMLLSGVQANMNKSDMTNILAKNLKNMHRAGKLEQDVILEDISSFAEMINLNMSTGTRQLENIGTDIWKNFKNVSKRGIGDVSKSIAEDITNLSQEQLESYKNIGGTIGEVLSLVDNVAVESVDDLASLIKSNYEQIGLSGEDLYNRLTKEQELYLARSASANGTYSDAVKTTIDNANELFNNLSLISGENMDYVVGVMADSVSKMDAETITGLSNLGGNWTTFFDGIAIDGSMSSEEIKKVMIDNLTAMQKDGSDIFSLFSSDLASYLNEAVANSEVKTDEIANKTDENLQKMLAQSGIIMPEVEGNITSALSNASANVDTEMDKAVNSVDTKSKSIGEKMSGWFSKIDFSGINNGINASMTGVDTSINSTLSNTKNTVDKNTKDISKTVEKNTKDMSKSFDKEMDNIDNSAKTFTNTTTTIKKDASGMYNGASNSFIKLASNGTTSFSDLKTSTTGYTSQMRKLTISDWDAMRTAFSKKITGEIEITKTEKTNKSVVTTTTSSEKANRSILYSLSSDDSEVYARQEAMRSFSNIQVSDKMAIGNSDVKENKKEKTKETISNKNVTYNYTYNSPVESSISELRRKDRIQSQRLALSFR